MDNHNPDKEKSTPDKFKFLQLFLSAGIMGNPTPIHQQKKLTHVITNIFILKGNLSEVRAELTSQGNGGLLKSLRFMNLDKDYFLAIQYSETIKSSWKKKKGAIYGVKIIRESEIKENELKRTSIVSGNGLEENIEAEEDLNFDDIEIPKQE
jgi:hypothetical protein